MRIEDKCGTSTLMVQPVEQMIDEGGLTGAGFSGQQHQALAALYAVGQLIQGPPRLGRQVKIRRVGVCVGSVVLQPKDTLGHRVSPTIDQHSGPGGRRASQPGPSSPIIASSWEVGISCSTELLSLPKPWNQTVVWTERTVSGSYGGVRTGISVREELITHWG